MNRILILAEQLESGGVEKSITALANLLVNNGYDTTIVSMLKTKFIFELNDKVKLIYISNLFSDKFISHNIFYRVFRKIFCYFKLQQFIKAQRDCVIISSRNEYSVLLSKYGDSSVRKIAQLHHDYYGNKKLVRDFKYRYRNIDYFVQLTDELKNEIIEIIESKNKYTKVITIPNIVEKNCENSMFTKEKNVIAVGRFCSDKNFIRLIELWKKIHDMCPDWKLILIGDGEEKTEILYKIEELKLKDSIILTGFIHNYEVLKYFMQSSIYLMTSRSESFGIVLVEAMRHHIPIVAFDVRVGPRAIIQNGKNGFLINPNSDEDFVNKTMLLINNSDLLKQMGNDAYIGSLKYTEENILTLWKKIL